MNKSNKNKNYMGVHLRTWYGETAMYLLNSIKDKKTTLEEVIQNWNNCLGEGDSFESEEIDTNDCDKFYIVRVNYTDYIIMFSNCESEVDMMCDIYEIKYEL